jgi:hypothetical protein
MRRFLLLVFVSCTAASVAAGLWPRQLDGYLGLFERHTVVNSGVAVTVVAVLTVALVALRVRLWRARQELARARRGLAAPPAAAAWPPVALPYPPAALPYPPAWGSRPVR